MRVCFGRGNHRASVEENLKYIEHLIHAGCSIAFKAFLTERFTGLKNDMFLSSATSYTCMSRSSVDTQQQDESSHDFATL